MERQGFFRGVNVRLRDARGELDHSGNFLEILRGGSSGEVEQPAGLLSQSGAGQEEGDGR